MLTNLFYSSSSNATSFMDSSFYDPDESISSSNNTNNDGDSISTVGLGQKRRNYSSDNSDTVLNLLSSKDHIYSVSTDSLNDLLSIIPSRFNKSIDSIANTSANNNNNNEECISECSTICPDSVSQEKLKQKYSSKVKELVIEHNQHLNDLNVLRRIFMYWLSKYYETRKDRASLTRVEALFGNINEV